MATADMIERADKKPKAPPRASWITRKDSILINRAGAGDDIEQGKASRTIVRLALGKHECALLTTELCTQHLPAECTCPEPECSHTDHSAHVVDALAALKLLGLAPHEHVRYKTCTACNESLPTTDFSPNPRNAGGRRPTCKPCHRSEAARGKEEGQGMKATLGMTLGQIRAAAGIPREQVAAELDVHVTTVSGWATGATSPSIPHAVAYARMLGRRLVAVLGGGLAAEGEQLADLVQLRNLAGVTREQVARRLHVAPRAVEATEMRFHGGSPLATCARYLEASGYRVGFIALPTAHAFEPASAHGHATLARYVAMDALGYSPARIRRELDISTRQFTRYVHTANARRIRKLQEAS